MGPTAGAELAPGTCRGYESKPTTVSCRLESWAATPSNVNPDVLDWGSSTATSSGSLSPIGGGGGGKAGSLFVDRSPRLAGTLSSQQSQLFLFLVRPN